jgi:hypothetical protein
MKKFTPDNLKTYICSHVFENSRPILLVVHEDGDWVFSCGNDDHADENWKVVGVGHLVSRDSTLNECADLKNGYEAERSEVGQPWIRIKINDISC